MNPLGIRRGRGRGVTPRGRKGGRCTWSRQLTALGSQLASTRALRTGSPARSRKRHGCEAIGTVSDGGVRFGQQVGWGAGRGIAIWVSTGRVKGQDMGRMSNQEGWRQWRQGRAASRQSAACSFSWRGVCIHRCDEEVFGIASRIFAPALSAVKSSRCFPYRRSDVGCRI